MQKIECNQYPLIGKLLSRAFQMDQKIHRSTLMLHLNGQINVYYSDETFVLECDTTGDHNPNEYYFFKEIEHEEAYKVLTHLSAMLGEKNLAQIEQMTSQAMEFLKKSWSM